MGRDRIESDRSATGALKQADAVADEDRSDMHDDLVQKPGLESLPGDIGAQDDYIRTIGGLLGKCHRLLDTHVDELAGHALHDRGLRRRVVAQHEERPAKGASVEARLQAILDILRAPANQQRPGRSDNLVGGLAWPAVDAENPSHVIVWPRDVAVQAQHRVPDHLPHPHSPSATHVRPCRPGSSLKLIDGRRDNRWAWAGRTFPDPKL